MDRDERAGNDPINPPIARSLEHTVWTGHTVRDERNRRVGAVVDVYYDDELVSETPRWLVVDPGPLRRPFVVPAWGARVVDENTIMVPWTREHMKAAPHVSTRGSLTEKEARVLERHYRMAGRTRELRDERA